MAVTSTYIFNQYYIDLLKKIKVISKKYKNKSKTAQKILKIIKEHYMTLDKASDEYLTFIKEKVSDDVWESYLKLENDENDTMNDWFKDNADVEFFKDITIGDLTKVLRDNYLCHHYCSVFYIFKDELTDETSETIVKILQTINNKDLLETIENKNHKKIIIRLEELRNKSIKEKAGIDMNSIEETSLGKLAKEILEDIDISKLKDSIGDDGDVLKAISDPNSGFADLLTNVSKKMATKISSGEIKQENLLQDAMKFATMMPGMFSQGGAAKGGNNANMPDMSSMMSMMGSMMGGMNNNDMNSFMKEMAGGNKKGGKKGGKSQFDSNKLNKMKKAAQMREKLRKQKEESEVETQENVDDLE